MTDVLKQGIPQNLRSTAGWLLLTLHLRLCSKITLHHNQMWGFYCVCVCVFVYFYLFIYFYSCLGQILCTRVKFLSCLQGFHGNLGLVMCSCSFGSVGGVGGGTDEVSSSSPPRSMVQIVAINVYFQHCVKKVAPVCSICLQHNLQRLQGIYKTG